MGWLLAALAVLSVALKGANQIKATSRKDSEKESTTAKNAEDTRKRLEAVAKELQLGDGEAAEETTEGEHEDSDHVQSEQETAGRKADEVTIGREGSVVFSF